METKSREAAEPYTNRTGQSLGNVFETLAARRRRYVLYYLNDHPEAETTLYELVDLVIAWEHMIGIRSQLIHHRRVAASLHNCHLPALCDTGLIEYGDGIVSYRVNDEFLQKLLSRAATEELPRLDIVTVR